MPADRVRNTAAPILLVAEPAVALWLANLRLDYPTVSPPGHRTTSADHCVRRWATGVCLTLPPARINLDRTERATGCPDTGLANMCGRRAEILGIPRIPAGTPPDNAGRLQLASMHSQNQAFGKALRSLRKARKVTQRDLAIHARLDRSYVSAMELGENSPTLDTLLALCRGLDISLVDMSAAIERELASNH